MGEVQYFSCVTFNIEVFIGSVLRVMLDLIKIWNGGAVPEKQGKSSARVFLQKIGWGLTSGLSQKLWQQGYERSQPCRPSKTQELMRPEQWWSSNLVSRGPTTNTSGTLCGRKCWRLSVFFVFFKFFFPNQKISHPHNYKFCYFLLRYHIK